jgi:multiple sugar transport system permease protein
MNRRREALAGYLFAAPWFVGMTVFLLYPLFASVYFSFCDYSVLKAPMWIGLANYSELFHDEVFWKTMQNTAIYAIFALPCGMFTALGLAMLLNARVKGMAVYRTLFFIPALVPQIPLAVLWTWLFNGDHGIVNNVLKSVLTPMHVDVPNWLGNPAWSKPAMVVLGVWGAGNTMLIFLASLQDVPTSLVEACELDGANSWQKTLNVTLPMISPVILFNLVMGIIGSIQVFAVPYVMFPGGGPERSAYFYASYLFDNAFTFNKMGYASAMGWIMFLIILVLTFASMRLSERHVHYGGG